jgi:ATP-dependent RNA helicase DeaD
MTTFDTFGLSKPILTTIAELGYEAPSPVQSESIPALLEGNDLLAQAQTGTGKTAAFALPLLMQIDVKKQYPQAIILAPTRELAIQVAEALKRYSKNIAGFQVLPIYGGQNYSTQLKALKRGVHVIVGTPGRMMDHMRQKKLKLDAIKHVILDEADEMLKMGFIDDVQWILEQIPDKPQTALFSATMPPSIHRVAKKYLNNPIKIHIAPQVKTVSSITQYAMMVSPHSKLEALTRFLEVEPLDAAIIFTRTKIESSNLSEKLEARGYSSSAINGDMSQNLREKAIARLKKGTLDILVATDVAARGIDVGRISHVINYDIPHDTESYVHRIGRTGRAGRTGTALLFVSPREKRMLRDIEHAISQKIEIILPPSTDQVHLKRGEEFKSEILNAISSKVLDHYREQVESLVHDSEVSELDVAAALAYLLQKSKPSQRLQDDKVFLVKDEREDRAPRKRNSRPRRNESTDRKPRKSSRSSPSRKRDDDKNDRSPSKSSRSRPSRKRDDDTKGKKRVSFSKTSVNKKERSSRTDKSKSGKPRQGEAVRSAPRKNIKKRNTAKAK